VTDQLARMPHDAVKQVQPQCLSITQATESGTLYQLDEVAALAEAVRRRGLMVHMDGARFANAIAALGCSPAEMTWKTGVDLLSFGATKNGAWAAEAVVFFDPARAQEMPWRRKRSGHTLSKGRFVAAQFEALLADDHWLDLARHANRCAATLAEGLCNAAGLRLAWPCEANEVFAIMPYTMAEALRAGGAVFHPWSDRSVAAGNGPRPDEAVQRLVCSFATSYDDVARLVRLAAEHAGAVRAA
jgi:threonine aldolase